MTLKTLINVLQRKRLVNKFEYYSLLAKKNNDSKKRLPVQAHLFRGQKDNQSMQVQDVSITEPPKINKYHQHQDKEKAEINALEHLSYMNACARMELLNANSKLMNFHILKKHLNQKQDSNNNKSMDFTLTFKSDFKVNGNRKGSSNTRQNRRDKKFELNSKALYAKNSFSNILEDNPATLIKQ
jgi:hypothetical protein